MIVLAEFDQTSYRLWEQRQNAVGPCQRHDPAKIGDIVASSEVTRIKKKAQSENWASGDPHDAPVLSG
jgi:hypothetical protein